MASEEARARPEASAASYESIAHDISDPHQWAAGRVKIVDATGDYAGLRGRGRFTIVVGTSTTS
jgi:hypothetical protein